MVFTLANIELTYKSMMNKLNVLCMFVYYIQMDLHNGILFSIA